MPTLHPTAVVDRNAKLADDVHVGAFTVIGPRVRIGAGTSIGSHCVVEGRTTLGRHNRIFHHVTLGQEPQDLKFRGEDTALEIGDHNDIREFVTMHVGTANGGGSTTVGSHNLMMVNAHIAHDCHVRSHCVLANNVMLAGHVEVQDHVVISGGAAISHFVTIGKHSFLGGLSGVVHDCPPFMISDGHPAKVRSLNRVGLQRHHFDSETLRRLEKSFLLLYGKRVKNQAAGLEEVEATLADDPAVRELVEFIRSSKASTHGRRLENARPDNKRAAPTR